MATRFVRIDLSNRSRDFRPVAVEPGLPLLDPGNSNARIVFRWLGGLAAEPEWEGESVNFFARDDHGGRLEDAICLPASGDDLRGCLKDDVELLRERLRQAAPETATERAVHRLLSAQFEDLVENEHRTDHDSFVFRYKDVQGRWRLVWCWGYQRVDQEPASAVICTDVDCGLLFVRRPGQSPKCPSCEALLASKKKKRRPRKMSLLLGLLLFLLGAGLVYWWLNSDRLVATPETWSGPAGSRIELDVQKTGLFSRQDVGRYVVAVADDPRVIRFDPFGMMATARSPGRTFVTLHYGSLKSTVTFQVGPPEQPDEITIEPESVELGIGTTARLKLIGHYPGGVELDLTETAQWEPKDDGVIFAMGGFLEGLAEGESQVTVRYRANAESEELEATAGVVVSKFAIKSMEMEVDPDPVSVGRASRLRIDVISEAGRNYSVLGSSRLSTEVQPPHVAAVSGADLRGAHPGHGRLAATFDERISAEVEFDVNVGPGLDSLVVAPAKLGMVVGEVTDLSIASPSAAPIRVTSSDPKVVEIGRDNRLIGRGEGAATVEVTQAADTRTVEVAVSRADILSIAVRPASVVVPVDHSAPVRVMGRIEVAAEGEDGEKSYRNVELAPDLIECDRAPSPQYADFDRRTLELHGLLPTSKSNPQQIALRYQAHRASAPVEVVVAPFRFELTPAGKVDVPLGQYVRLQGWAVYGSGLRVQLFPDRVQWLADPPSGKIPGLELRGGRVAALKVGAGPLTVWGKYLGRESNRVALRSVEAAEVDLRLEVDRTLRLAGEPGAVMLTGSGPKGDVELVPELAAFESSDPKILSIDPAGGKFQALAPGTATVVARHVASTEPVRRDFRVIDPATARLVFEPGTVRVAVGEVAVLRLYLESRDAAVEQRAEMAGPGIHYHAAQPAAIDWRPPVLRGESPAGPFGLSASYYPWLQQPATAQIEVVASAEPAALRVIPESVCLAPGQTVALRVEEQLSGSDEWREVQPGAVAWNVPAALLWAPARDGLRPVATVPPGTSGEFSLTATVRGAAAECAITTKEEGPDPNATGAHLAVDREPEGLFLPVGASQRYAIVVEQDGQREPAAGIRWQADFENDYVRWKAPVLTAKRPGHAQWLEAEVAGRTVRFYTYTYEPARAGQPPLPSGDRPIAVRILSDQGASVRFPVGATFDDFRVEAEYADGFTRMVTNKATLRTPQPPAEAMVAPRDGRLVGLRPGQTVVQAEFEGVASTQGLGVDVTGTVDIDEIRIRPAPLTMMPGETMTLDAVGYKQGKSVGIITGLGGLVWKSTNEQVAGLSGPAVTAGTVGRASITAERAGMTSLPAEVDVVDSIAEGLVVDPKVMRIRVGESIRVGVDLRVTRGPTDVSRACTVYPALRDVLRYDEATRCLVGVAPGTSPVSFILGKKLTDLMVEVVPGGPLEGRVVVEPPSVILAPGQTIRPRVFLVTKDGMRIDRTEAATLNSSAPQQVMVRGFRATDRADHVLAVAPGTAEITASLPEAAQPGHATVMVNNEPITDLIVEPPRLDIAVGDSARLGILGRAASGTYELFPQDSLRLLAGGPNPAAIKIVDPNEIEAVGVGQAEVAVNYEDRLSCRVPVNVVANVLADLQIDPPRATIHPGEGLVYQVTGTVGGQRRVLGPEDGVQLTVRQPAVAQVFGGMTVGGSDPGRTGVVATLGNQQAEALLEVTPGLAAMPGVGPDVVEGGLGRVVQRLPDGSIWLDGHRYYYRPDEGWVLVDGERGLGPGGVDVPLADNVAGLRFVPDTLRLPVGSDPAAVRVVEVLRDGSEGRDVTAEPGLELTQPADVAKVERTAGGPAIRPIGTGETRVGARLGTLTAEIPLKVTVSGDRFVNVETTPNFGATDFTVTIEVLSANSEGPLEYRVYGEGTLPPERWETSQEFGQNRRVVLESPRLPYRGEGALYNLVIESRGAGGGIAQRYPFTFRLVRNIERTDKP